MHLFGLVFLFTLLSTAISIPPPPGLVPVAQRPPTRNLPVHLRNITHNTCCITPGLTFDPCTTTVPCAYGRYCVTSDSLHPCPPGIVCICYPAHIILCQDPAHCPFGETCAYRPHDHHPFCVSINVVDVDPSYLIFRGGCLPCSTSRPPTTTPYTPSRTTPSISPTTQVPTTEPPTRVTTTTTKSPTTQPPSTRPPTTQPPTTQPPTTQPPTTQPPATRPPTTRPPTRPPTTQPSTTRLSTTPPSSTRPPTSRAPSTRPPTRPETAIRPSTRPSPTPLKSRPPSPRPSPPPPPERPSHRPVITVVPHPTTSTPAAPTQIPKDCLAGDPCSSTSPCCGYRKCKRADTLNDCNGHSDCICLGSRVCVCNDQCTDGEVCAGPPGKSYCFSPRLIDKLSWSTTLPCVGPAPSPEIGDPTRPPTTTLPARKIPGLTGEICRSDANCRSPRKCIAGGGASCLLDQVLCDKDPTPCRGGGTLCYCYTLNTCNCNNDCKETEICTATARGRICVSSALESQSEFVQAIECPGSGRDDGKPILIVNEPEPIPPVTLMSTPRPTPSPVRLPGVTPEVASQDVGGAAGVCIDARALYGFHAHQLVFERHPVARVLCDANDSCATPGHIVMFYGKAMMMKTYCNAVGCESKILQVNSPRLKRKLRVPSNSHGLDFTAFAARHETKTEEAVLAIAVRMGL